MDKSAREGAPSEGLLTWFRVTTGLLLLAGLSLVLFQLFGDDRFWVNFEKRHHCQMSERRGEWATFVCDDKIVYSRKK
jgi:hypothetical protein